MRDAYSAQKAGSARAAPKAAFSSSNVACRISGT